MFNYTLGNSNAPYFNGGLAVSLAGATFTSFGMFYIAG
jgi:hypothetical protein